MKTSGTLNYAPYLFQPFMVDETLDAGPLAMTVPYGASSCIDAPDVMPAGSMAKYTGNHYRGPLQTATNRIY